MTTILQKLKNLPQSPGVYIFYDKNRNILYVGKATSLKDRVGSYFQNKIGAVRTIEMYMNEVTDLEIKKTDTVLEAYILEQSLIKKLQPKYNAMGKDDKSFTYVLLSKEEFPRFAVVRETDLDSVKSSPRGGQKSLPPTAKVYGPYTSKRQIEAALKILRKIFPYHNRPEHSESRCFDYHLGLCPGPYDGKISKKEYVKNIRAIKMILEGKKKGLINRMKKEMEECSDKAEFEKAAEVRNRIFALQHIQDVALISDHRDAINRVSVDDAMMRIEGYDISNISGKFATGSMVVFDNSDGEMQPNKSQYRKFKIKNVEGANDVGAMEEMLTRRFRNNWPRPNLILLDGGAGHLNMARKVLRNHKIEIPLLAVAKGPARKKLDLRSFGTVPELPKNIIEQVRNEAHRFAISYHRKLRGKSFTD
ncbi:MAG: GIY-YIG nuclease family protein [Candidatus Pacebacteria bacterium]|nr:GIY-YIG nuclease family protein [Candidatus Paceibacterota bacterium]